MSRMMARHPELANKMAVIKKLRDARVAEALNLLALDLGYTNTLALTNNDPFVAAALLERLSKALVGVPYLEWDGRVAAIVAETVRT
jgi:hypothetical protein